GGGCRGGKNPAPRPGHEKNGESGHNHQKSPDRAGHGVGDAPPVQLGGPQAPPRPKKSPHALPVHGGVSSRQLRLCAGAGWARACSRKWSSSEPPPRISASDACSTTAPLTMMPTWVHSFSTISRTCEVRNTVEPRDTKPLSRSRMTRDVTASTPSNGSSR